MFMNYGGSPLSAADVAAVTNCGNNRNDGMWGGDGGWWVLIILFAIFGWGGNGFGGWGGGNGIQGALTRADLCQDMNFGQLENAVRGVQQGICDSTFALNNTITNGFATQAMNTMQGFNSVNQGICNLGYNVQQGFNSANVVALQNQNAMQAQLAECCCENRAAIAQVRYDMATDTCALQNTMNQNTRDIIDSQNAGTRAILDYLCQDKIATLQSENQALRLSASQANQNNVLMAAMDANKAEILRKTGAECPTAAYIVQPPQPVSFPTNCCGQFSGWNGGGCCN